MHELIRAFVPNRVNLTSQSLWMCS
jgi:hypothetical protein